MARAPAGARPAVLSISSKKGPRRIRRGTFPLLAALLASLAGPAIAQADSDEIGRAPERARQSKWEVIPSLSISETYTDNVFLSTQGNQTSDWVTQLVPGIAVTSRGPRLTLDAWYAPEITYYARTEREDKVFHKGNAIGTLELSEDLLYVEAGAKVDQYDVSLRGPQTTSNVNITNNRATALSSFVSPYLRRDLGSSARVEARFTYSTWRSDEEVQTLPDNDASHVMLRLESGPAYRLFTWKVAYSGAEIRYVTQQVTTSEDFLADGRWALTPTVGLLMQAGYERYDTGIAFDPIEDPRWSLGLDWTPTARTRLAATSGQRLGDETYSFEFRHRTRLSSWSVAYAEDVTTSREQFFVPATTSTSGTLDQMFLTQYPDPAERQRVVQDFIARTGLPPSLGQPVNFFSDELFLQKRWSASVGLQGARNTVVANVFWELRKALTNSTPLPGDFVASDSIRMTGGSLAWNRRLSARTAWNLEAGYTRTNFVDTDQVDDFTYIRAGLTRQLQPRVSASLFYRRQQLDSTFEGNNYVENAGVATLRMTF